MKTPIFAGEQFGYLIAIHKIKGSRQIPTKWHCRCECNRLVNVRSGDLRCGNTISCGCKGSRATIGERTKTHGMTNTNYYRVYRAMINRCYNNKLICYPNYGGRRIVVCERWHRFENFFEDMGMRPDGKERLTLDRINNNGNYEPGNCRWATYTQQARNKRKYKNSKLAFV